MRFLITCVAASAVTLSVFATPAAADTFDAYTATITTGTMGNGKGRQTLRDFVLGLDFRVDYENGITIRQLGVWDDKSGDGLLSPHSIMIYDLANPSVPLARVDTLPGTGELRGGYRYFDLPQSLSLPYGTQFSVVVYYGPTNLDSNGNSGPTPPSLGEPTPIFNGNGYGYILNIGIARYGSGFGFPGTLDTGPANRYHSGSFSYSPQPEPGTFVLLSGVVAAFGAWRRRARG